MYLIHSETQQSQNASEPCPTLCCEVCRNCWSDTDYETIVRLTLAPQGGVLRVATAAEGFNRAPSVPSFGMCSGEVGADRCEKP